MPRTRNKKKQHVSPAKTGGYSTDSGRPPDPATNMAGTSGSQPTPTPQRQQAPHKRDDDSTLPRHPILTELQGDENPPRAEPTRSAYEPESPERLVKKTRRRTRRRHNRRRVHLLRQHEAPRRRASHPLDHTFS